MRDRLCRQVVGWNQYTWDYFAFVDVNVFVVAKRSNSCSRFCLFVTRFEGFRKADEIERLVKEVGGGVENL